MLQRLMYLLVNCQYSRNVISRFMRVLGCDIPKEVRIKADLSLPHGGMGVVIHPKTQIGSGCRIYQHVTIGRTDIWNEMPSNDFKGVVVGDGVIICAGAVIITQSYLSIGTGTIIGANSVLTQSTGEYEVWSGIPAKFIKQRFSKQEVLN